jgi:hypothetical protein
MSARRFFPIAVLLVLLVAAGRWGLDWTAKRPLAMTGGLYFPSALEIPGPHFLQADRRWAADPLGFTPDPLAEVGCAVASAAMVLASRGVETDPGHLNAFLQQTPGGYTPEGWIYWEKAAEIAPARTPEFLPHYEDAPSYFLLDWNLLHGNPVIARVRSPNGVTHFVVVCGKTGFEYLVRDPAAPSPATLSRLSALPPPVEALRFYQKNGF